MKLLLLLLLPLYGLSQNSLMVFLEVENGQQVHLVNDSLFDPSTRLLAKGILSVTDSTATQALVEFNDISGTTLFSASLDLLNLRNPLYPGQFSFPLGQYTGLNCFNAEAVLKSASGDIVDTLFYSSEQ